MPRAKRLLLSPLAVAVLAVCGSAVLRVAPALATSSQEAIFQDDIQLRLDTVGTLLRLKELGADRVRVFLAWSSVAPGASSRTKPHGFDATNPAAYPPAAWAYYDGVVRTAAAVGIGVYFDLTGTAPRWAARGGPAGTDGVWKPSAHEFGSFVKAVARRYSGTFDPGTGTLPKVSYWGIWNEPNYGVDLAPQTVKGPRIDVSPAVYRGLVDAAYASLHTGAHAHDTILIGELAPRGQTYGGLPGTFGGMVPIRFVRALYCLDAGNHPLRGAFAAQRGCPTNAAGSRAFYRQHPGLFDATGFADHPYPQGQAPLVPSWRNGGENLYADWTQLPALERLLDVAQRTYGRHRRYPIYNTEFGDQIPRVRQTVAAYYLNWFEYLSWRDRRLVSYDQYLLVDPPGGNFSTGLEDSSGRHLAIYDAFRLPLYLPVTVTHRGRRLEVWGDVRPGKYASPPQPVAIQFQPAGGGAFTTLRTLTVTQPRGYFDTRVAFPGSGTVRLEWTYPGGGTVHSRSVAITVK